MLTHFVSQGLFRVAPSASKLKKLKASLDCGVLDVQEYSADPHAIAGKLSTFTSSQSKGKIVVGMDIIIKPLVAFIKEIPTTLYVHILYIFIFYVYFSCTYR